MTRRVLLVEIGTPAELPVVTPPAPRPPSAWVPDPRPSPGLPPPTGLAAVSIADAAVLSWTPSTAGGQTIIEAAPDVAGVPGIWREVTRVGGDTYTISLPGGPRWVRVRAELNGRTSVATNAVLAEPVPVGDISEFEQELRDLQDLVDAVAAQAAADAAALNVRADDLRADIDATIAEVSTLADLTDDLGTEITRVETESVARDTATVETISLLGAKNGAGTAFILDGNTLRVSPTETLAQWRNSIQGEFASQSSRIDNEVQARQDGDQALATTLATVQATANNAATKTELTATQNALAAADQALGESIELTRASISAPVEYIRKGTFEDNDPGLWQWATVVHVTAHPSVSRALQITTGSYEGTPTTALPCEPGDVFDVSADVYGAYMQNGATGTAFGLAFTKADGTSAGQLTAFTRAPGGGFQSHSGELVAPAGSVKCRGVIFLYNPGTGDRALYTNLRITRRSRAEKATADLLALTRADVQSNANGIAANTQQIAAANAAIAGKASASDLAATQLTVSQQGQTLSSHGQSLNSLTATAGELQAGITSLREVSVSTPIEIIRTGQFRAGSGNKGMWGAGVGNPIASSTHPSGAYVQVTGGVYEGSFSDAVSVTPGDTVDLVVDGFGGGLTSGSISFGLAFSRADGSVVSQPAPITVTAGSGWQMNRKATLQVPAGAARARGVIFYSGGGYGGFSRFSARVRSAVEQAVAVSAFLAMNAAGKFAGAKLGIEGGVSNATFLFDNFDFETADGSFRISDGRTITRSNGYMRVEGKPFGQNNEMVVWYGPEQSNLANCRRNNAISFETNNGLHYSIGAMFSGTISAGGYTTAIAATSYSTGAFSTNGGPIVVNASFTHSRMQLGGKQQSPNWQKNTISAGSGTTSATIELWRRIGTGNWQLVASATREGVLSIQSSPGEPDIDDVAQWNNTVSLTYTDNAGGTQNRDFEVRVIQNVYQGIVISGSAPVPPPTDSRSLGVRTSE